MASSSSNPSSTSSSTTSTRSAARPNRPQPVVFPARALSEEHWPELPRTRSAAQRTRAAAPPTNPARAHRRGGRRRNSARVSQYVPPSLESGWESAADPTSTSAPAMWSTEEVSSSSASALSAPFPSSSTMASTPTDTTPASAATSSTKPSRDSSLVPNASGSAPAVETIAHTVPESDASTSSAPVVPKISDLALAPGALTSASSSAPKIVDASLQPGASASTPSSAPGVTTIADPSATTSAPGAAPTIPSLRDNWVALRWGIVPRPVERCPRHGQQAAFGGNGGMPPVEALYPADPLCPWREQVPPPPFGVPPCWVCRLRPARVVARPCGHLGICVRCYCYANSNSFVCPYCGSPITWRL